MRTLLEREWIKIVGQREAPGRPAIYGTTKAFLDYFGVRSLDQLPPLDEIREMIEPVIEAEKPQLRRLPRQRPRVQKIQSLRKTLWLRKWPRAPKNQQLQTTLPQGSLQTLKQPAVQCNTPHPLRTCSVAPQQSQADQGDGEKLQKVLAAQGLGSRRQMENWITEGRVSVNGTLAHLDSGSSAADQLEVDGQRLGDRRANAPQILGVEQGRWHGMQCRDPEKRLDHF